MRLKESQISLAVSLTAIATMIWMLYRGSIYKRRFILYLFPLFVFVLHILPFILPFFVPITSDNRKPIKAGLYVSSACFGMCFGLSFIYQNQRKFLDTCVVVLFSVGTVCEALIHGIKWLIRKKKKNSLRRRSIIRRQFGNAIRMPPISVSTEARHLRAKLDFVSGGKIHIRKGETVELLKTIGSYYSVRNSSGEEYIVSKTHFF